MPKFSEKSEQKLNTCHSDLQRLFNAVILEYDCAILCGHRGKEQQEKEFAEGDSKTHWPKGAHNKFPSEAVDVVSYPVDWNNKAEFYKFAAFVLNKAHQMGIRVKWGGFFKNFFDGPHFQLVKGQIK